MARWVKYFFVSAVMTPERPRRAMRFGMAMSPFTMSARDQMASSLRKTAEARMAI